MIALPTKAKVQCSDGAAGFSTYLIFNPSDHQLTNLVVRSIHPPFVEHIVSLDQVEETKNELIKLKCSRKDLDAMEPFVCEQYVRTKLPEFTENPQCFYRFGLDLKDVDTYIPVKYFNIAPDEMTLRHGAKVEATDGIVGQVAKLLINSDNMEITHIVLHEKQLLEDREITIPVSQIERVIGDTVYLKLDRQSVKQLPTPIQCWPQDEDEKARLELGADVPLRISSEGYIVDNKLNRRNKMEKMLVVVFENELKAYDGLKALQELQSESSINLYAKAVIVRDADGKVEVKQKGDMGPVGTAVGLLTGSLIGLIGGPVGLAIGAYTGTVGGMFYDMANIGISEDFLFEVEKSLLPGKAAVVAEVYEEWTLPVDARMEALGGVVIRRTREDFVDAQMEKDAAVLEADLAELKAERDQATGEARAKLQAKVDNIKAKLQTKHDEIQARIDATEIMAEDKLISMLAPATKESEEQKTKREARIAELRADQKRRNDQLKESARLAKDALFS